jgi:type II secretory ATPase GspE/PulE/Tfp pilus assembly ATPase PilB-like protein
MLEGRNFTEAPVTVTVGLVNGHSHTGQIRAFHPEAPELLLTTTMRTATGTIDSTAVRIPTGDISYVAIYREGAAMPDGAREALREYNIYVPGGNRFAVLADADFLGHELGFYAYPLSAVSLYGELFFYDERVNAKEDRQPLGALLIDSGVLGEADIDQGFAAQVADRAAPIGQILVEQQAVGERAIEKAVKQQGRHRATGKPIRLGEILVEAGLAAPEDIDAALSEQKKRRGRRLGEVLVAMGIVDEDIIATTLARKFHIPYIDLDDEGVDPDAVSEIPAGLIDRYHILPYRTDERSLHIAMADPLAVEALDMLRFSLSKQLKEVMVRPSQLEEYLVPYLAEDTEEDQQFEADLEELLVASSLDSSFEETGEDIEEAAEDETASRLAYRIILAALRSGASDIHVEPNGPERATTIRFRVDGQCFEYRKVPATQRAPLVARIKILADLDITERRKPQDGKIKLRLGRRKIELRVATLPTVNGNEDVVMRILAAGEPMPVDALGLDTRNLREAQHIVHQPYGLVLVVGPTGAGKTTTLHSLLGSINTVERKIWTAEDPVEITQAGLRQVQVHPRIGFDFAAAMRSFLRADPDVIMVGEMRDEETASTGVEASLTGHLVFSTLHTNSAPETITRLLDMGLDPFTFSDALLGVLAQRLARRLCIHCRRDRDATPAEAEELAGHYGTEALERLLDGRPLTLWTADGCDHCGGNGYKGRLAVHELLVNTDEIRAAIQRRAPVAEIRSLAAAGGMTTLLQDGIAKCLAGHTDLRQVLAVCAR